MSFSDNQSEGARGDARAEDAALEKPLRDGMLPWPLNRREFVVGAGAATVLIGATVAASRPSIQPRGRGVAVIYRDYPDWEILPEMFSRAGVFPIRVAGNDDTLELSLSNALLHGTGVSPDFDAKIQPDGLDWRIQITFAETGRTIPIALGAWMRSRAKPRSPDEDTKIEYEGPARNGSFRIGGGAGWHLLAAGARIGFRADFSGHIVAAPNRQLVLRIGDRHNRGFLARCAQANFSVADSIDGYADFAARPQRPKKAPDTRTPNTLIQLTPAYMEEGVVGVGQIEPDMKVVALFDQPTVTLHAFETRNGLFSDADCFVRVRSDNGAFAVLAGGAGVDGARVQLTAQSFAFLQASMDDDAYLSGRIANGFQGIEADSFAIEIESDGREGFGQTFGCRPLKSLSISTSLRAVHVPMDRGAVADGYVEPTSCELLFQGALDQPRRHIAKPKTDALVWIGHEASALEMPLHNAKLRVSRCRDLFDLTFGFRNYALSSGTAGTTIRHLLIAGDAPLLAVEFAPQHLFEEAFQAGHRPTRARAVLSGPRGWSSRMSWPGAAGTGKTR